MNADQIAALKAAYAGIDRMDPCGAVYPKICALLDGLPDAALAAVAGAEIKFVSLLAQNRVAARRQPVGVFARFKNGNSREMIGLAAAHARRQYAAFLARADVVEANLIYARGK